MSEQAARRVRQIVLAYGVMRASVIDGDRNMRVATARQQGRVTGNSVMVYATVHSRVATKATSAIQQMLLHGTRQVVSTNKCTSSLPRIDYYA